MIKYNKYLTFWVEFVLTNSQKHTEIYNMEDISHFDNW